MPKRLTDAGLRGLLPGKEIRDEVAPGLAARRQGAGGVSFVFVWASRDKKAKRLTLGKFPAELELENARHLARDARKVVGHGGVPIVRLDAQGNRSIGREGEAVDEVAPAFKFGDLLDLYVARLGKSQWQVETLLAKRVPKALRDKPVADVSRRDIQGLVDEIEQPPKPKEGPAPRGSASVAAAVGKYITAALNFGEKRGHVEHAIRNLDLPEANPPGDRILSDDELAALLKDWLPQGPDTPPRSAFPVIFLLQLLTAGRWNEVSMIRTGGQHPRAGQLDLDAGLIVLSDSKGNRPIRIVLPRHAVRVLRAWPRYDKEIVFPVERKRTTPGKGDGRPGRSGHGSVSGFNTAVTNSRKRSGVADWSTHDLRRTCATGLERLGVLPDIIDRVLNHAKPKLRSTYLHYDYEKERREALERWGAHVFALAGWA